jgi:glutamate racemase
VSAAPIGVFDSGVGGLTVFAAVERAVPEEALVYLGDTARVPYGTRSPETVVRYSIDAARFLRDRGIKLLVVACNTASAVALGPVAEEAGVPVLGVIGPGARRAAEISRSGRIGVIGTRATVKSDAYATAIHALRPAAEVLSRACPLFVPLAEEGFTDDSIAREVAERYLAPLKEAEVDTLVLGCTHYPLLGATIGAVMGPHVRLVDSAEAVAEEVRHWIAAHDTPAGVDSAPAHAGAALEHHFFVTDSPEPFQQVAERFLGRPIRKLERV